jgi:hypothetical protein
MNSDAPQSNSFCSQGTPLDSFFDGAYIRSVEYLLAAVTTVGKVEIEIVKVLKARFSLRTKFAS